MVMNLSEEMAERMRAELGKFVHRNNTPDMRKEVEAAMGKVLAELKAERDRLGYDPAQTVRVRRLILKPGGEVEVDLLVPPNLIPPEMLPDYEDDEGDKWKR